MGGSEEQEIDLGNAGVIGMLKLVGVAVLDASPGIEGYKVELGGCFLKSGLVGLSNGAGDRRHSAAYMGGLCDTGSVHIPGN